MFIIEISYGPIDVCSLQRGGAIWNLNLHGQLDSDIITHVICLWAMTAKRWIHQYVHLCFMLVFMRPRHFLREVAATIRTTVSDDTVTAFRISAVVVHALCFVSKGVCNLCAADNPRADDKSFITAESRHSVSSSFRTLYLCQIVLVYTTSTPERAEVSAKRECIRIE